MKPEDFLTIHYGIERQNDIERNQEFDFEEVKRSPRSPRLSEKFTGSRLIVTKREISPKNQNDIVTPSFVPLRQQQQTNNFEAEMEQIPEETSGRKSIIKNNFGSLAASSDSPETKQ